VLVTDARLDNRADLGRKFGWSPAESAERPDGAFVLAAYETWGETCPDRLEGQWAFAVWHRREARLFAAIDPLSFRPFYYFRRGHRFVFASTLRALLALPDTPRDLDEDVLADFLLHANRYPDRTAYRAIHALPDAHWLRADAGGVATGRYRPAGLKRSPLQTKGDCLEAFRHELEHAVAASLRVSGPVGAMVSGGLDSSAIVAVAGCMLAERGQRLQALHQLPPPGDRRQAFGRELDESAHVRRLQAHLPHVDFHFLPPPAHRQISFERWDAALDEHCAPRRGVVYTEDDSSVLAARQLGLRRLLFGLGGNYAISLEAGSSHYFPQLAVRLRWWRLWREVQGFARFHGIGRRRVVEQLILDPLRPFRPSQLQQRHQGDRRAGLFKFLNPDFVARTGIARPPRREHLAPWAPGTFDAHRHLALVLAQFLPQPTGIAPAVITAEGDCEGASPFLTERFNAFCLTVPVNQQISGGRDRLLLRRTMQGLLPDEIIWRRTRGFPRPLISSHAHALATALPAAFDALEQSPLASGYLNLPELRRQLSGGDERNRQRLGAPRLLDLFNLAWFLRWLDRPRA
jgi:asparagine synthase (glutamine-hydrolysing)